VPEPRRFSFTPRSKPSAVQIVRLAERQDGVVSRKQLLSCGLSSAKLTRWLSDERLQRIYPGVYAVGHRAISIEGRLIAALLHAGNGAALSHTTAAWWWELLSTEPGTVHLSASGRCRSMADIRVHRPRGLETVTHRRLPVTTIPRTLLDIAAVLPFNAVRRALAEADHKRLLDPGAVRAVLGRAIAAVPPSETHSTSTCRSSPTLSATSKGASSSSAMRHACRPRKRTPG
jgi:hypothetical protein